MAKTINLDGEDPFEAGEDSASLISEVDEGKERSKGSHDEEEEKLHREEQLETKKELEDAEYKDLKKRFIQDERDKNFVLNERDAIIEAVEKESDKETNELDESIDKIEEEQDLEFKDRVALISHDFMKDIKFLDEEKDSNELNNLHKAMIQKVFDCFLENKQELLKKIANKLSSHKDMEDYISGESETGKVDEDTTPRYVQTKRSDASYISKGFQKRKNTEDTYAQESKSAASSKEPDFMENIMDVSESDDDRDDQDEYEDHSAQKKLERKAKKSKSKKRMKEISKESESNRTHLMNIQTTADLISYVKRRQNKKNMRSKPAPRMSKKTLAGIPSSRLARREGVTFNQLRHLNQYQKGGRSVEIQTDDLDILDLRVAEINLTEVYHFDKISSCLRKLVIERGSDAEILRQFEYLHKDTIKSRYRAKHPMGKYGKALTKQDQFRKNISDVVSKVEIHRYNDALKALINKVKDYEHENAYLEEKRS